MTVNRIPGIKDRRTTFYLDNLADEIDRINDYIIVEIADTGTADTEFTVSHDLNRIPVYYLVVYSDKACSVYDSGTAWTDSEIYLKCDAANVNIKLKLWAE